MSVFDAFRLGGRPRRFAASEDPFGMPQERTVGYDNIQPVGFVEPGVVDVAQFASGIRPVQIVDSLPALPDTDYPVGSVVYLTTDGKLYRNVADVWTAEVAAADGGIESVASLPVLPDTDYPVGSVVYLTTDGKLYRNVANAWTAAVPATDITGQITETQITDDAITTPKIAANAVTAGEIAANAVTADKILASAVTTDKLNAGAVTAAKIATGTITANELAANSITSSELSADSVIAGKIAAAAVSTDELAADAITADKVAAGAITADKIESGAVTASKFATYFGNLVDNPSFEIGDRDVLGSVYGWSGSRARIHEFTGSLGDTTPHGLAVGEIIADGVGSFPALTSARIPVKPGSIYRLRARLRHSINAGTSFLRLDTYDKDDALLDIGAISLSTSSLNTWVTLTDTLEVPLTGDVTQIAYVRILAYINVTPPAGTELLVDAVELVEVANDLTNTAAEVTIDADGISVINGSITVASDSGSTVIIDGTSQMFKIMATGTQTRTFSGSADTALSTNTNIGGSGSSILATIFQTTVSNSLTSNSRGGDEMIVGALGGAADGHILYRASSFVSINSSLNRITLTTSNEGGSGSGLTAAHRYYLLKEAGI